MATLSNPPARSRDFDESRRRVQHPLQRLRRWIRSYVTAEGLALLLLYLALWFWIGLALDWGAFALSRTELFYRIFHEPPIDWVLILPPWFRGSILLILVAGLLALVALKVFVRLFYDFRESALALVLERRFPKLLGDRLITAVELADRRKAARYGYSQEMIDETVAEAADRVDRAPLGEVFNWGRLAWQAALLIVLVLVAYAVVGAGACAVDYASEGQARLAGFSNFHDVSAM